MEMAFPVTDTSEVSKWANMACSATTSPGGGLMVNTIRKYGSQPELDTTAERTLDAVRSTRSFCPSAPVPRSTVPQTGGRRAPGTVWSKSWTMSPPCEWPTRTRRLSFGNDASAAATSFTCWSKSTVRPAFNVTAYEPTPWSAKSFCRARKYHAPCHTVYYYSIYSTLINNVIIIKNK